MIISIFIDFYTFFNFKYYFLKFETKKIKIKFLN